ncbi:MAG: hypothetical protein ABI477_05445 [Chryseolinea sp.]
MKTILVIISVIFCSCLALRAQDKKSVVIGTLINRPNAILVINPPNGDQGFLLPQLTSTQRIDIKPNSPDDDGLMVYDTSDKSFYYWNGGVWVKGFGGSSNQTLSFDALTQKLTLSSGNTIDLNTLKEIPTQTGNTGRYLTTNGTTLSWATISSIGDITGIITGTTSGLSGGATSGDVTLSVNTDATTISVNGANQLQLSNGAVSSAKIAVDAVNSSHIIDGSITGADIQDNSVGTADLVNASITSAKIGPGEVATANVASGGNDKVLTTSSTGVVSWDNKSTFAGTDNQNLSLNVNNLGISGGSGVDLSTIETTGDVAGQLSVLKIQSDAVNSAKILDGSITTLDLANGAVTTGKIGVGEVATTNIASGGNDKILSTDASGVVNWVNKLTLVDDNQNLSLAGNALGIDGATGVDLNNLNTNGDVTGPLNAQVIQISAVNSLKILDGTISNVDLANGAVTSAKIGAAEVAPTNILSGGNDKILTTNATGTVVWDDKSTLAGTDDQMLTLNANLLSIENGNSADLNNLLITGEVQGNLNNAIIQPNTITSAKIANGTILPADMAPGATNQVMTTNAAATAVQWVTPGGDVTGTVDASTVAKIQGRGVSNAAPVVGQTLAWDGTNWVPTTLTASTPTVQYLALDPSNFAGLQQDNDKEASLGLLESVDGQYAFAMNNSRGIVAAVNLPDGATIQSVTLFYQYTLLIGLAPLNAQLIRKPLGGGAVQVLSTISPILSLGVSNLSDPLSKVVDNSTNSYRLLISFGNGGDAKDAGSATSRVYGVRIQYLK